MEFLEKVFKAIINFFLAIGRLLVSLFSSFGKIIAWFASNLTTILVFGFFGFVLYLLFKDFNTTEGSN